MAIDDAGDDVGEVSERLDAAVVEEQAKALPARQRVADRFGELGLLAHELELGAQPRLESFDRQPAALLADLTTLLGRTAADLVPDAIELADTRQRFGGDRRGAGRGELVEPAAHVAPAEGELHVRPRPGSSTGAVVSSANSRGEAFSLSSSRSRARAATGTPPVPQDMGTSRLRGQPAFDQTSRRRRLHDGFGASPASAPAPGAALARRRTSADAAPGAQMRPRRCDAALLGSTGRRGLYIDHRRCAAGAPTACRG